MDDQRSTDERALKIKSGLRNLRGYHNCLTTQLFNFSIYVFRFTYILSYCHSSLFLSDLPLPVAAILNTGQCSSVCSTHDHGESPVS